MANKRMVNGDIWRDEFVGSLDFFRQVLWIGLIVTCADDQGRMADDMLIRNDVFPRNETVTWAEVKQALTEFEQAGRILRYESGGKKIIQIVNWWRYQSPSWAAPSRYPAPPGWTDKCRYHGRGNQIVTVNWSSTIPGGFVDVSKVLDGGVDVEREGEEEGHADVTRDSLPPTPTTSGFVEPTQSLPSALPSSDIKSDVNGEVKSDGEGEDEGEGSALPLVEDRPNVFSVYEQEIGPLTPMISNELASAEKEFTEEWVLDAMRESSRQNKRSWSYSKAILNRWKRDGRAARAPVVPQPKGFAAIQQLMQEEKS